jgi:hypothetical protein
MLDLCIYVIAASDSLILASQLLTDETPSSLTALLTYERSERLHNLMAQPGGSPTLVTSRLAMVVGVAAVLAGEEASRSMAQQGLSLAASGVKDPPPSSQPQSPHPLARHLCSSLSWRPNAFFVGRAGKHPCGS